VIYLHRFEEMTFAEIAAVLGTSEGAVKLRAFRGYEKLREELAPLLEKDQAA
jgi:RNA polymerase sigma-70 factor (ECF subfamily)